MKIGITHASSARTEAIEGLDIFFFDGHVVWGGTDCPELPRTQGVPRIRDIHW